MSKGKYERRKGRRSLSVSSTRAPALDQAPDSIRAPDPAGTLAEADLHHFFEAEGGELESWGEYEEVD